MKPKYSLIISGPTASGKTELSLEIAKTLEKRFGKKTQIVNADVGQFYTPLSIGTAKPDWQNMPVRHHLFGILDDPKDLNVVSYRKIIIDTVDSIWREGEIPIIVGGSLFYIKSLFFPPMLGTNEHARVKSEPGNWDKLYEIDPERAMAIHPNDSYRINRALALWKQTGKKPSELEPEFDPPFSARIIFIDLDRELLYKRINLRTEQMIGLSDSGDSWIEETKGLKSTEWERFLKQKKLIGYPEIFDWIDCGEKVEQIPDLIKLIQVKTRNYAKRQITFWKKFRNLLLPPFAGATSFCETLTIDSVDNTQITAIIEHVVRDLQRGEKKNDFFI
jgi:tRNA dimethylallyltransferase